MSSMKALPLALVYLLCSLTAINAIPSWEAMYGRGAVDALTPTTAFVQANVPSAYGERIKHLASHSLDNPSNVTVAPDLRQPPVFYVYQSQLYLMKNDTAIYPVNVLNTTTTQALPLQLVVGTKPEGVSGTWKWEGNALRYDTKGGKTNGKLFYVCLSETHFFNVFMALESTEPPAGCEITTLHSWIPKRK